MSCAMTRLDVTTAYPLVLSKYLSALCVCRVFGTVSYYVQKLFSQYQGVRYIDTEVSSSDEDPGDHGIAASASCQDEACTKVAFKVSHSLCCAMVSCVLRCGTVCCCATRCAMLCCAVPCCAMLCYAALTTAMCYAVLCCVLFAMLHCTTLWNGLWCAVLCYC